MRYLVLACDFDGTLAHHGKIDDATRAALDRLLQSGRKAVMVTGRKLDDLLKTCPDLSQFEWVVAEDGALLYHPATRAERVLGERPPDLFVETLRKRGVDPLSVGRTIVATWEPFETVVLETIRDLGLELQVIFNKGAVMVLPAGLNKAFGLAAALAELGVSRHNVVTIGDGENDHAMFAHCECAVAVANAIEMLKSRADFVTEGDHGRGVAELVDRLIASDLAEVDLHLARHHLVLGKRHDDSEFSVSPYGANLLIAGTSGGGKSTLATSFIERLTQQGYQYCVIDPEGDYEAAEGAVVLGNPQQAPSPEAVLQLVENPEQNGVVNLIGVPFQDRPRVFVSILSRLQELRARKGRPHWIIIDEAHHVLPAEWESSTLALPKRFEGTVMITLEPGLVAAQALAAVDTVIAVGESPDRTLRLFCDAVDQPLPDVSPLTLEKGEVLVWPRRATGAPFPMHIIPSQTVRRRHSRKYAEGELEPDRSFYFRGPEGKLNLRAHNLILFLQMAAGVDDDTWLYHLGQHDYSRWFREAIKDDLLGDAAAIVEDTNSPTAADTKERIAALIEQHYTLPATNGTAPEFSSPRADLRVS